MVNPTFDPIAKAGRCTTTSAATRPRAAARVPARARADPRRVPRPRRAPRGAGRAGPRGDLALPDARHALRGAAEARPEAVTIMFAPSTGGSTRTGASTTRTASSPRRTSRSPTSTGRSPSSSGRSDRGARTIVMRPAAPTTVRRSRDAGPDVRPVLGAGERGRASRSSSTPATAATRRNGYAGTGSRPISAAPGGSADRVKAFSTSSGRSTTSSITLVFDKLFDRFPNLRVASVENGSEFLPDLFKQAALDREEDARLLPEDPVETFRRTSGSTRSGRTTSTRWSS